ncbi:PAS domain S-box protein [Halorussus marinus]|uniref:PAS domain S-box protein n=1 Tax=Halorussus marinus TaxID=2505976 RepID=UPI00106E28F6|nr:PAS domain S-box protein [Halorussus marinus]
MSDHYHTLYVGGESSIPRALGADAALDPVRVTSAGQLPETLERTPTSCVVATADRSGGDVVALLDAVRDRSPALPFVVLDETADPELAAAVLAREATDYVDTRAETYRPELAVRRIETAAARYRAERPGAGRLGATHPEIGATDDSADPCPDVFFTLDASGELLQWNERASDVLGYGEAELAGYHPADLIPPDHADRVVDAIERVRSQGSARIEVPLRTTDGRELPYEFSGALLEPADGGSAAIAGIGRDVTRRRRRATQLAASREKYRRLVETAPDAVFIVDAETGRILDTNEAAAELLGKPQTDIVGMHQTELHPASERERYRQLFESHVDAGGASRVDDGFYVVRDDGREIPVEISAGVTEIGDRTLNQAVFRDVTARKQREETLEALREVTRDLMAAGTGAEICGLAVETAQNVLGLPISGIHLLDDGGTELRPVAIADAAERLFDDIPSFEEGEGLIWEVYREGSPRLYEDVGDQTGAYNPETPVQTEMILPLGDHGVFMAGSTESERLTESKLNLAKILTANIHTALDRAERERQIERQRDELQAELEEVFERIDDGFFALDDEWRVTYVNERAERLLGASERELRDRVVWQAVPELRSSVGDEAFRRAAETQRQTTDEAFFEPLDAWLEFHVYPSETGLSVYFRDVSERKRREQRLEQQNARLESFASMVAHEFRNPLSIAQIYLQAARDGDESAFDDVAEALDRMEEMIDVLLIMTRGGESVVDPETVSLGEVASQAWSDLSVGASRLEIASDLRVRAERHHLRHLLSNLFQNALEHGDTENRPAADDVHRTRSDAVRRTPGDSEDAVETAPTDADGLTVRVGELADSEGFYVEDDGSGIPEGERESVFEAGYTTDANGIGLGLTFIAQLAETYGWEHSLAEGTDGGARFEFRGVDVPSE